MSIRSRLSTKKELRGERFIVITTKGETFKFELYPYSLDFNYKTGKGLLEKHRR